MDVLLLIGSGLWVMVPALVPNPGAVIFGGGTPVDLGRQWKGARIFGDGKTWRGLLGGISFGILIGCLQIIGESNYSYLLPGFIGLGPMPIALGVVATLAIGSLLGDMGGAFIKRRWGMERGQRAPVLDQYDSIAGGLLLTLLVFPDWIMRTFIQGDAWISLIAVIVAAYLLHRSVNIIGYKAGLKKEPW
jgi:CDP-2,3-bis-(O-geranylgeranyl)-sn-glycerol synthase